MEEVGEERELKRFNISKTKRAILREIKSIFHIFNVTHREKLVLY